MNSDTTRTSTTCRHASRLGFSYRYSFACFAVFGGTLFLFSLVHLRYLDFHGTFCRNGGGPGKALPGECFYFLRTTPAKIGIILHLWCIVPAGALACVQFVPVVRRKTPWVHRVNGYLCMVLGLVGAVASVPIIRHAFGGGFAAQSATWTVGIIFVAALLKAYLDVKRRRISQHRAWMLRAWSYGGSIITMRIIMIASAIAASHMGGYSSNQPCDKIKFVLDARGEGLKQYPGCDAFYTGEKPQQQVIVDADVNSSDIMKLVSALNLTYGKSSWLAILLHTVGIEIYLWWTSRESAQLLKMSHQHRERGSCSPTRPTQAMDKKKKH